MPAQKTYHETFIDEAHHGQKTRRILSLKKNPRLPISTKMRTDTRLLEPTQHSRLQNPFTLKYAFGYVPRIEGLPQDQTPATPIILPFGRQGDRLSGFGAKHIAARHSDEVLEHGAHDVCGVAYFIATALRDGASLFWQGHHENSFRICAYRPGIAKVVLEYRNKHGKVSWNVITAFRAHRCDGDFVGSLIPVPVRLAA